MKTRSVTLNDVAKAAGVSYQTVSRVLNHAANVAAPTRQKVEAAMQALNYVPNRVAQQLAGKSSRTLGLATSDLALLAPAQIASAIHHRARALGWRLVIAMAGDKSAAETVQELLAQRVDALLVNLPLESNAAQQIAQLAGERPCLFLDVPEDAPVMACQFSAEMGARQGIEHLIALGHRHIALLSGPVHSIAARTRFQVWQSVLKAHQLAPHSVLTGDWSAASGYHAVRSLLKTDRPGALLVANDQMALGALRALHEAGLAVPGDISVVGFDDTAESAWYQPPLTTVRQDMQTLGAASVDRAIRLAGGTEISPPPSAFATTLVVRETTAKPAASAPDLRDIAVQLRHLAQQVENACGNKKGGT